MRISFEAPTVEDLLDSAAAFFYALAKPHQQGLNESLSKLQNAELLPQKQMSFDDLTEQQPLNPSQAAPSVAAPVAAYCAPAPSPQPALQPVPQTVPQPIQQAVQQPIQQPIQQAQTVPVSQGPAFSMEQISVACVGLCDMGKRETVLRLLTQFGVQAVTDIRPEQVNDFVIALRGLGAAI